MLPSLSQYTTVCPGWLRDISPSNMASFLSSPSARKKILENSLVYPGGHSDWSAIRQTLGMVHSYVYFNFPPPRVSDNNSDSLQKHLEACKPLYKVARNGARCVGLHLFDCCSLLEGVPILSPPHGDMFVHHNKHLSYWALYEMANGERVSILYLIMEAINGINALYIQNRVSPRIFVLHDQIMGHGWGSFAKPFNRLIRESGLRWPDFLIIGQARARLGPEDAYRILCYDKAKESMFRNIHSICVFDEDEEVGPAKITHKTVTSDIVPAIMSPFYSDIVRMTVPCTDNGTRFVRTERLHVIEKALDGSDFSLMENLPLARFYRHRLLDNKLPVVIVSAHVDSVYGSYWAKPVGSEICGTLDNSACVAVLVKMMAEGRIPPQTLVVFTGDEEADSRGADQVANYIRKATWVQQSCEFVVSLDLTEEFYGMRHYSIENVFAGEQGKLPSRLRLNTAAEMQYYFSLLLADAVFIIDAAADDSWQYDEHGLTCFSLCLPCRNLGADMHDDDGVSVRAESLIPYAEALDRILTGALDELTRVAVRENIEKEHKLRRVKQVNAHVWNAIRRNDKKAVAALIARNLDMETLSPEGKTLVQFAEVLGRYDIAKILRDKTNRISSFQVHEKDKNDALEIF